MLQGGDLSSHLIQAFSVIIQVLSIAELWHISSYIISSCRQGSPFCCSRSCIQGHLATCTQWVGFVTMCSSWNEQGEPISADRGWDPAFPTSWGEAVQQLTEQKLPACEPRTLRLSWTTSQPRVVVCQGRHTSPDKLHSTWSTTAYAFWADLFSATGLTNPQSKDSLPCPSFKKAKEIIILSGLSWTGNMLSFFLSSIKKGE